MDLFQMFIIIDKYVFQIGSDVINRNGIQPSFFRRTAFRML